MIIPRVYIEELRILFRTRMQEQYFCIGEKQVEKLFRELLEEPEPEFPKHEISEKDRLRNEIINQELRIHFDKHLTNLFERDDAFYKKLK